MKLATVALAAAALAPLANACAQNHEQYKRNLEQYQRARVARQASSSSVTSSSVAASTSPAAASGATTVSGTVSGNASSTGPPQVSVSLLSQNPTAVPLLSISASMATVPTVPLPSSIPAGATPSVSGAPVIPDISGLNPANYPPMDKIPPTDSAEVQAWIQQVNNSGVSIPNLSVTTDSGSCAGNPQAAADSSRCWWTCGGCVRDTDITTCPDKLTWGLTHDDGPGFYTPNLLDYLDEVNLKTTFFTIGSRILEEPHTLQTEYIGGHQIGVHTWSHPPLTTLTTEQIIAEFGWTKKIIKDLLGVTPLHFRPPYGDIDDRVRAIAKAMELTPVMWTRISATATFDTGDFNINGGTISSTEVMQNFNDILGNATQINTGFIVLEHDLFQQTVDLATGYIIPEALAFKPQLSIKPVITCMNLPMSDAFIETNDNTTNPLPVSATSAVTLSSGAPGSAQASGGAASGKSPAMRAAEPQSVFALAASSVFGAIVGAAALL